MCVHADEYIVCGYIYSVNTILPFICKMTRFGIPTRPLAIKTEMNRTRIYPHMNLCSSTGLSGELCACIPEQNWGACVALGNR